MSRGLFTYYVITREEKGEGFMCLITVINWNSKNPKSSPNISEKRRRKKIFKIKVLMLEFTIKKRPWMAAWSVEREISRQNWLWIGNQKMAKPGLPEFWAFDPFKVVNGSVKFFKLSNHAYFLIRFRIFWSEGPGKTRCGLCNANAWVTVFIRVWIASYSSYDNFIHYFDVSLVLVGNIFKTLFVWIRCNYIS